MTYDCSPGTTTVEVGASLIRIYDSSKKINFLLLIRWAQRRNFAISSHKTEETQRKKRRTEQMSEASIAKQRAMELICYV